MLNRKGNLSLEFLLYLLIILLTLSLLITTNVYFKERLEEDINYKEINQQICFLKKIIVEKNNGEITDDVCKESTSNDP